MSRCSRCGGPLRQEPASLACTLCGHRVQQLGAPLSACWLQWLCDAQHCTGTAMLEHAARSGSTTLTSSGRHRVHRGGHAILESVGRPPGWWVALHWGKARDDQRDLAERYLKIEQDAERDIRGIVEEMIPRVCGASHSTGKKTQ